jgi:bla regulator protein blaR1
MIKSRVLWAVGVVALICGIAVSAQTPAGPTFEVASVKANKSGDKRTMMQAQPGGRLTATNVPLRVLIGNAYRLQDFQLIGGPDWIASERFDIVAKATGDVPPAPPGGPPGSMQFMLQALLADRFKLVVHQETRELAIYALVVARSDGKLGSQLRPSTVDCEARVAAIRAGNVHPPNPQSGERPMCGIRSSPAKIVAGTYPLSQLANAVSPFVQRKVVDRTGLAGNFDFDLSWTPDLSQGSPGGRPFSEPPLVNGQVVDLNGPSIFTALQEQLGLKLDSQKDPVDVLVIDHVERPTEN